MIRPGRDLLVTPNPEELRGKPGVAREAALAAAKGDAGGISQHVIDAAFASIAAGEPREALRLLDRLGSDVDDTIQRRAKACRAWAEQIDANLYPGWTGGELSDEWRTMTTVGAPRTGDPETMLLEAYAAYAPVPLYSIRQTLESMVRIAPAAAQQLLPSWVSDLQEFANLAHSAGYVGTALWAMTAQADIRHRCGHFDAASQALQAARNDAHQQGDPIGVVQTLLTEGDWYATPGASPEALGFDLTTQNLPSPLAATANVARAKHAYDEASAILEAVDAPRAHGAVALRHAGLAAFAGAPDECLEWLGAASTAYSAAGDAAGGHLVTIHTLLARIATGDGLAVRADAGGGWDLSARGPIAEIVRWAHDRGSGSWCTGLGRLCQRVGESWEQAGEYERAETAYLLAIPLIPVSGAVTQSSVLAALALLDDRRNFAARALVRLDQALKSGPSSNDELEWLHHADLLMSMSKIQTTRGGSSQMGRGLAGLRRTADLIEAHLSSVDVPTDEPDGSLLHNGQAIVHELLSAQAEADLDQLLADEGGLASSSHTVTTTTARALRLEAAKIRCNIALSRLRLALTAGWDAQAEHLYAEAIDETKRRGPELSWMAVLVDVAADNTSSAHRRLEELRDAGVLPDNLFATLAVRAGAYETAQPYLEGFVADSWQDVVDRAEVALGTGDPESAIQLAIQAVQRFEDGAQELDRDVDLVAYCDNVSAEFMYMLTVRAWLGLAAPDERQAMDAAARAFAASDRPRSLSLRSILSEDADAAQRDRQRLATEWSAAFEQLVAALETAEEAGHGADLTALNELDRRLVIAEGRLGTRRPSASADLSDGLLQRVQERLPDGACLIQYHVAGREFVAFGVTETDIVHHRQRLDQPIVPGLVHRFVHACASSDPGDEAEELAALLLDPVTDVLAGHPRVIIVPYGPLTAVPFHALSYAGGSLIDSHDVSYLQAASLLERYPVDSALHGSGAVVVGDPEFDRSAHPTLRRLPGALTEARDVGRLLALGADEILTGPAAEEAAVGERLAGKQIVHLAAHGRLNDIAPAASSIVLAGHDELTVADLIGLHIDAGLMVLSACDTGRGSHTLGGDLIGLTRGLLAAGVQRTMASLWPVYDIAACVTMDRFYHELTRDHPIAPAAALASAQRAVKAMTFGEVEARYKELGGGTDDDDHLRRRATLQPPASAALRTFELAPEFIDVDEIDDKALAHRPTSTAVWAPFVMVGQ